MSQIKKKFVGSNEISGEKIRLDNNTYLRSRNAADSADVNLIGLNTSNEVVLTGLTSPVNDTDAATKQYVVNSNTSKNYIANNNAASNTTGWNTYSDSASALPTDGTGGSPSVTWTRSTTTPLRGSADFNFAKDAANRQGQGVSYDFTIDSADKGKVLNISFDYETVSGTYSSSDLTVYIYNITDAVVIQPSGYTIQSAGVPMKHVASFQTSTTSTSYRLILHVASSSASAYTLAFTNFILGPGNIVNGTPITDWVSYTPTFTGFGTPASVSFEWKRDGSDILIRGQFATGSPTGVTAAISLPSGLTSASTLGANNIAGTWFRGSTVTEHGGAVLIGPSVSTFKFGHVGTFSNSNVNAGANALANAIITNGETIIISPIRIPIAGWSSNVQMSSDTDTRVVAARYVVDSAKSYSSTTVLDFPTRDFDTHSAVTTGSGWQFTAPMPGYYFVSVAVQNNANSGGDTIILYKNNASDVAGAASKSDGTSFVGSLINRIIYLNTGDYLTVKNSSITSRTTTANAALNYFQIYKLSGTSLIAETEKIEAVYKIAAGVSTSTTQPIDFATKVSDTHGAVTTGSSWKFTAPAPGTYLINMTGAISSGVTEIRVYKNGVDAGLTLFDANSVYTLSGSAQINLIAGDYIDLRGASAVTLLNNSRYNISISRIK